MENWFTHFGTELLGTFVLIILGNGIVANVVLKNTKGNNAGWLSITIGWSFAVIVGATIASALKGAAHLNPAVTIAFVVNGWEKNIGSLGLIPIFIIGQIIGAILAQIVIDVFYIKHITNSISENKNKDVLAMHSTGPQYRNIFINFFCEFFATLILVVSIFSISSWFTNANWMGPIFVGFTVLAIGLSLGGTTGYAINPFRDLCPRIVHQLLPLKGKSNSDWSYSWIPVIAPMLAGILGGALFLI